MSENAFYDLNTLWLESEILALEVRSLREQLFSERNRQPDEAISATGQEPRRELQRLNQDLHDKDMQLTCIQHLLESKDRWLSELDEQLTHRGREVERLVSEVPILLGSRQLKIGRVLDEIYRRLLLRPKDQTGREHLEQVVREFQGWNQSRQRQQENSAGGRGVGSRLRVKKEILALEVSSLRSQLSSSLERQPERELQRLHQLLYERDLRLTLAERLSGNADRRLSELDEQLTRRIQEVERLASGISILLDSRQWSISRSVGELHRRLLLRPKAPTVLDHLKDGIREVRRRYQSHQKHEEEGPSVQPSTSREELALKIRERIGPAPERISWPLVSIIVINRNGLKYLRRLFSGLEALTDYPNFEVILIDNGSIDGSVGCAKSYEARFPVRLVENTSNTSFSAANNQGVETATGDLLLFLNNDIEPFESGWLKELVNCMESSRSGAVGALLLYPGESEYRTASGFAVQHRGIKFRWEQGAARACNLGAGDDALGEHLGADAKCPAATAACLLIERGTFDSIGGFTESYRYGQEDVDLSLKLAVCGQEVVSSGRTVLFHHELGTQDVEGRNFVRINRTGNQRLLQERWGPQLNRELLLDRLGSAPFWSEEPAHVAIPVTCAGSYVASKLGDALGHRGWRVTYLQPHGWYSLPRDTDYLLVLLDFYDVSRISGVISIAWIRDHTERWTRRPWFEKFDVVLASSGNFIRVVEQGTNKTAHLFPAATNPERFSRTLPNPAYEADYVFTGDYWGEPPNLVNNLDVASGETFMIFGEGWEKVPRLTRYARGHLPYDQLPQVYSSAKLVLDDSERSTQDQKAFDSRIFDALATGTLVVTSYEDGARELFDEDFPTYSTRQELRENLDRLLGDEVRRAGLATRYREIVLREHTYERRAEQLTKLLGERAESLSFCIKVDAPNREAAWARGDLLHAQAIQRELERCGHPCVVQDLDEWDNLEGLKYDVAIHLKGPAPYVPKPSQFNVLWTISRPDLLTARECDRYDLIFVSSERWASRLRPETSAPVAVLQQATDPEIFFPEPDPIYRSELVFVSDSGEARPKILQDILPTEHDLSAWGVDREGSTAGDKHVVGCYPTAEQVRKAYSSASIVLVDHRDEMREYGCVSNQVYDALACGALVISPYLPELGERFGDTVVTYDSVEELRLLIDRYLQSPEEREGKGRRGRELATTRYTFEHRVEELLRHVEETIKEGEFPTRIRLPTQAT